MKNHVLVFSYGKDDYEKILIKGKRIDTIFRLQDEYELECIDSLIEEDFERYCWARNGCFINTNEDFKKFLKSRKVEFDEIEYNHKDIVANKI